MLIGLTFFHVDWSAYLGELVKGIERTIEFTAVSYVGAVTLAALIAMARVGGSRILIRLAVVYTEIFKNVPLLTWIFVIYYGLASAGLVLSAFVAGSLSLTLFYGAYISEIFRGGIQGVDAGQLDAAQAIGLTGWQVKRYVVLPQAARLSLTGTATMVVDLLKATSLLVTIAGSELMTQGQVITSVTFRALQVYIVIGAIYFLLCYPTSQSVLWVERRLQRGVAVSVTRRRWQAIAKHQLAYMGR